MNNNMPASEQERRGPAAMALPILEQLWFMIFNHKWIILTILAASLLIGLVLTLLATPLYTATARIEISRAQDNITNVEGVQANDIGKSMEFFQTQYALLEAKSMAQRVANALNLTSDDSFFEAYGVEPSEIGLGDAGDNGAKVSEGRGRREKMATRILRSSVAISPVRGSSLVDVNFTSPDPTLSAKVANSWVEQFIESNLDRRYASTEDARKFLESRLSELRQRLEESERNLVTYAAQQEIVQLDSKRSEDGRTVGGQTLVGSDLEAMNKALSDAISARVAAQSGAGQNGSASEQSMSNATIAGLRQQRAIIAAERANLLSQFEPEYPSVKALTSQVEELDSSIRAEERRVKQSVNSQYREALQRETTLRQKVQQLKSDLTSQNRASIQYNIYQREVDTNRQLYDGLLQRYKEIGVAGVGSNNIQTVDRATRPNRPSSPNLQVNLSLAFFLGVLASGAYVFAREQIDQSLRDPSDIKRILGITDLGAIPTFEKGDVPELLQDRKSISSEAYFSICTSLSFLTDHGVPRSMAFTSTRPNEGKSTSAFAVGVMLARMGKKTLLIDGDMRNPSVDAIMDVPNEEGLSNYLSGNFSEDELPRRNYQQNLDYLVAGPTPPNAAELLSSDRLSQLVTTMLQHYDHVLIDAPPVMGIADSPLIAKSVEGVIFSIEANGAKMRAIRSALERLSKSNAHVFGAILTKLDGRNSQYGYGYAYGYGYGNDQSKKSDEIDDL
ncbi:MAG: polysaccharide biosynthesis tyrosine autokinase [Parasphingorhabdus sp.]|uniref:GumC family protein n=2 Tax=Parasphingorhabdus sp. TaxID=2709688 RepID=UPI003262D5E5